MPDLNFAVLHGSYRSERMGQRVVKYVTRHLEKRGHGYTIIDAKEKNLPILDKMYKEYPAGKAPAALEEIANVLRSTDGFLVVSGEYNHGVQPGLKNLMDHFLEEYFFRPSAIVSYSAGIIGGARAALQWRVILAEMGASSIPSAVEIGKVEETLNPEGERNDGKESRSMERFFDEFEWYARALKTAGKEGRPY